MATLGERRQGKLSDTNGTQGGKAKKAQHYGRSMELDKGSVEPFPVQTGPVGGLKYHFPTTSVHHHKEDSPAINHHIPAHPRVPEGSQKHPNHHQLLISFPKCHSCHQTVVRPYQHYQRPPEAPKDLPRSQINGTCSPQAPLLRYAP